MKRNDKNFVRVSNKFDETAKCAKSEIKEIKRSPLYYFHLLEKLAKKQMRVENDTTNLADLLKRCGGKFAFGSVDIDSKTGKICKRLPIKTGKKTMISTINTYLGVWALCPVACNEYGILESIKCRLNYLDTVATDLTTDKKQAQIDAVNSAAKIAAKERSIKVTEALKAYNLGMITRDEFVAICAEIAA